MPPHHSQDIQQHQIAQQLGLGLDSPPKEPSPIASRPSLTNFNKASLPLVTDQSLVLEDHDGLGEDGDKGIPGNRWPRQETLALLKIRSDMDVNFRDSNLKGPLWEEISRKLSEMGYHRSAKKCKEKFENVHKYYKRTKDGKAGRQDGKSYRFFTQLEALYGNANYPGMSSNSNSASMFAAGGNRSVGILGSSAVAGAPAGSSGPSNAHGDRSGTFPLTRGPADAQTSGPADVRPIPDYRPLVEDSSGMNFSSDSSDDEYEDARESTEMEGSRKRKRKPGGRMMVFFENLLKKVIEKQEQMQQKFLEVLERREQDRMIREEAWKRQEMARMSREQELRSQERSLAATRDAALVAFLQKVTGQSFHLPSSSIAISAQPVQTAAPVDSMHATDQDYSDREGFDPSSKRWPKPEVLALIKLRSGLHPKFTEPGPKGPLWEEISSQMSRLGYSRNAKRCKEKWENINKYFKKAKESNKKRPEDAKTCPYFHQLDALYRKGVLGATSSHIKQLSYKTPEDELVIGNREDGGGHVHRSEALAIMPPEQQSRSAAAAVDQVAASTMAAGAVTTHLSVATDKSTVKPAGVLDHVASSSDNMQIAPGGALSNLDSLNFGRKLPNAGISTTTSRPADSDNIPTDSSLQRHDHEPPIDHSRDSDKMNRLEMHDQSRLPTATLVVDQQAETQQQHINRQLQQQHAEDSRPPPPSFMAYVQKFGNDPPADNNASTPATTPQ